jgi:vancomycin aglycone glucosyltransferase
MKSAAEVVGRAQNSMSLFPEVMARVIQMWVDKSATLASLAHGADLLLAGINEQAIAANVAECQGIPLAALALLPGATFLVGAAVPEHDEGGRRRAASCAGLAGGSGLRTRRTGDPGYEESCVPGLAAEWGESAARRPFVGALTVETLNATLSGRGYSAISSKLKSVAVQCNTDLQTSCAARLSTVR